jgi:hypothetical protein
MKRLMGHDGLGNRDEEKRRRGEGLIYKDESMDEKKECARRMMGQGWGEDR